MYYVAILKGKVVAIEETGDAIDAYIEENWVKGLEREARFV